jgi:hypothetical protein
MLDRDRFRLLGKYKTPRVRVGSVLSCESRDCDVIVMGYSDARIPWPVGRKPRSPARGLILYGGLAAAVCRESNLAVCYWFGVTPQTVSKWRKALGVEMTNAGTGRLRRANGQEDWFAAARAKVQVTLWTAERRARMSEKFNGKPLPVVVVNAIRKAQRRQRGAKHTPEARAKMRATAAARLARGDAPNGRVWTPDQDAVVRAFPPHEAARKLHRPVSQVYKRRRKLKVPDGRAAKRL